MFYECSHPREGVPVLVILSIWPTNQEKERWCTARAYSKPCQEGMVIDYNPIQQTGSMGAGQIEFQT